jgi:cell division protein FtsQ
LKIGQQIKEHKFWKNQIEQINITDDKKVEMIPRVGNQLIYLGSPIHVDKKLDNLETFYKKVMHTVGWNKYSKINLEFENQIICTKNKK